MEVHARRVFVSHSASDGNHNALYREEAAHSGSNVALHAGFEMLVGLETSVTRLRGAHIDGDIRDRVISLLLWWRRERLVNTTQRCRVDCFVVWAFTNDCSCEFAGDVAARCFPAQRLNVYTWQRLAVNATIAEILGQPFLGLHLPSKPNEHLLQGRHCRQQQQQTQRVSELYKKFARIPTIPETP